MPLIVVYKATLPIPIKTEGVCGISKNCSKANRLRVAVIESNVYIYLKKIINLYILF